jgi:hypothetical protein
MTLSILPLPDDALVYMLSDMNEIDVETCRAVSKRFKSLIDERQPFPEYYLKAKEVYAKIIVQYEKDSELHELKNAIKIKTEEMQKRRATMKNRLSHMCSFIDYWTEETLKERYLELRISSLQFEAQLRQDEICQLYQYDRREITHYQSIRRYPEIRQPIIDIFGSMKAFEKLPIFGIENRSVDDVDLISAKELSAPLMRGIDVHGRVFFVLRATNIKDKTNTIAQTFLQRRTNRDSWISAEAEVAKTQIVPVCTPLSDENIPDIKKFIETKQNDNWNLA